MQHTIKRADHPSRTRSGTRIGLGPVRAPAPSHTSAAASERTEILVGAASPDATYDQTIRLPQPMLDVLVVRPPAPTPLILPRLPEVRPEVGRVGPAGSPGHRWVMALLAANLLAMVAWVVLTAMRRG